MEVEIMASTIQVRVDDELKTKSDALFKDLGTDTTSAIRMFLTQAARNLLDDFEVTKSSLAQVAGSLKDCTNPKLKEYGYKRINFMSHRYFMLYRIQDGKAVIDNIFHQLQDYENQLC